MKNLIKFAAMAALALTAVSAMAQPFPGGGGGGGNRQGRGMRGMRGMVNSSMLLMRDDVRDELVLTDDQKDKLKDLQTSFQAKMRENFQNMRNNGGGGGGNGGDAMREAMTKMAKEADAEVAKILTPDQSKRLGEIKLQLGGGRALLQDDVATALNLSADQKTKIKSLADGADGANRGLFQKVRDNELTMEQVQEKMANNAKALDTEVMKVLTDDQKAKLETLKGKKFEEKEPTNG